jgi:hypothetical protein
VVLGGRAREMEEGGKKNFYQFLQNRGHGFQREHKNS